MAYKWCGFHVVERAFPSVFLLTSDKDVCLADNVSGADIFFIFLRWWVDNECARLESGTVDQSSQYVVRD